MILAGKTGLLTKAGDSSTGSLPGCRKRLDPAGVGCRIRNRLSKDENRKRL